MTDADSVPSVSVVIPARNAAGTLGDQLAALAAQQCPSPFEVIVVDNASTDTTREVADRWLGRVSELRVVPCVDVGLNNARNAGTRAARAERVLICDADDVVAPGWVSAMNAALEQFDIVAGRLDSGQLNDEFLRRTRDLPVGDGLPHPYWGFPYAWGGNMGFDRTVFDRVGGFDPKLQGAEELDFCWRAQYAGFTIGCAPDAVIAYRFRPGLRAAARQSFASGRGNAQLRALHIRLGKLPAQTRWQQGSLIKRYLLTLAHVQRLRGRVSRRRYLQDCAWFAGSLAGLARYGAIV